MARISTMLRHLEEALLVSVMVENRLETDHRFNLKVRYPSPRRRCGSRSFLKGNSPTRSNVSPAKRYTHCNTSIEYRCKHGFRERHSNQWQRTEYVSLLTQTSLDNQPG